MIVSTKAIILTYWRSVQTPSTGLDRTLTSFIPRGCGREVAEVAAMLKAIHALEDRAAARPKAEQVATKPRAIKASKRRCATPRSRASTGGAYEQIIRWNGC